MQGLPCLQQAVPCVASLPWPAVARHVPALIDRHAWPQVVHRQRRPCRRPLPPQRCALPPSLTSALAGRALAAALAALHRVLVDAAATADLIARAAAAAALAAAAPRRRRPPPLPPPPPCCLQCRRPRFRPRRRLRRRNRRCPFNVNVLAIALPTPSSPPASPASWPRPSPSPFSAHGYGAAGAGSRLRARCPVFACALLWCVFCS